MVISSMVTFIKTENYLLPGITAQPFPILLDNGKRGTFFDPRNEREKKTKSSSGQSEILHAGVIKFSFCALNINE